jgi:hypothetical protein
MNNLIWRRQLGFKSAKQKKTNSIIHGNKGKGILGWYAIRKQSPIYTAWWSYCKISSIHKENDKINSKRGSDLIHFQAKSRKKRFDGDFTYACSMAVCMTDEVRDPKLHGDMSWCNLGLEK